MVRGKPPLGSEKKEIACERARERGQARQGTPPTPTLLIHQFMALLFNKAIQGGAAQGTRCSCGSIVVNLHLV